MALPSNLLPSGRGASECRGSKPTCVGPDGKTPGRPGRQADPAARLASSRRAGAAQPLRRWAGVTLIELAITLAVLAVLGALALPGLGAGLERQRLQATAQALAADIGEARFEAARRGQALHVQASTGPAWCWSVSADPSCPCGAPQACQLRNVLASDHPGVQVVSAHRVVVEAAGAAQAGSAAVLESGRGERLRVDVSALGRTRICAAAGVWPQLQPC